MGRDLEAGRVPGGVAVRRPPLGAVHGLEGCLVGADAQGEERPQKHLALVPRDLRLHIQTPGACAQPVGLHHARAPPPPLDAHRGAQRAVLDHLDGPVSSELLPLQLVVLVYVPGVPLARLVHVRPQLVAPPVQNLAAHLPVVDAVERAVGPDLEAQRAVLEDHRLPSGLGPHAGGDLRRTVPAVGPERRPAEGRHAAAGILDQQPLLGPLRRHGVTPRVRDARRPV